MKNEKPVLAIETSGDFCNVAVYYNENKYVQTSVKIGRSHSKLILIIIKQLHNLTGTKISDVKHIALSIGPGSFTGLRIGLAAAKALSYGADRPIVPVSTFEAMANQIAPFIPEGESFGLVNKVNTFEVYYARFQKTKNSVKFVSQVTVVKQSEFPAPAGERVFGNLELPGAQVEKIVFSPSAVTIAALSNTEDPEAEYVDPDLLEPVYIKDFNINIK